MLERETAFVKWKSEGAAPYWDVTGSGPDNTASCEPCSHHVTSLPVCTTHCYLMLSACRTCIDSSQHASLYLSLMWSLSSLLLVVVKDCCSHSGMHSILYSGGTACLDLSHVGAVDRPLPAVPVRPMPAEVMGNEPDTILHLNRYACAEHPQCPAWLVRLTLHGLMLQSFTCMIRPGCICNCRVYGHGLSRSETLMLVCDVTLAAIISSCLTF